MNRSSNAIATLLPLSRPASRRSYLGMCRNSPQRPAQKPSASPVESPSIALPTGKFSTPRQFEQVYVHPAAGDAGLAVGAAYYIWHQILGKPRSFEMNHAYWGPAYSPEENPFRHTSQHRLARRLHDRRARGRRTPAPHRRHHRRRENPRLVSRPRRMGPPRARQPQQSSPTRAAPR